MANNRRKGHNLERLIARIWREVLGFPLASTCRAESKTMDDGGIDICGIPMLIQAKSGYVKNRPRFENVYQKIKEYVDKSGKKELEDLPIVLIHKFNGRYKWGTTWTFAQDDIIPILEEYYKLKNNKINE